MLDLVVSCHGTPKSLEVATSHRWRWGYTPFFRPRTSSLTFHMGSLEDMIQSIQHIPMFLLGFGKQSHYLEVSWNGDTPKSSIFIGCFIVNHPFGCFPFMDPQYRFQKINPSSACWTCCCFSLSRFWIISNDSSPLFHVMLEAHCVLPVEYDFFADYKVCPFIWCCRWWLCVGLTMVWLTWQ